jgi:CheY-like chemotaxis protein
MILIVDDHEATRDALAVVCRSMGYDARTAANGHAALKLMRQLRPNLVLLDLRMKGLSGLDVLRTAQTDPEIKNVCTIVFTGERGAEAEALRLGAVACVVKARESMDGFWDHIRRYAGESDWPSQQ